jgi:protoporphyrinogen/coproporphyrinogen III oxidase
MSLPTPDRQLSTDNCQLAPRVAVIGGGISGLAAALRLIQRAPACELVLFESATRLGGVLSTVEEDGFQVEQSADNFITTVPWGVELCKQLGLADQLVRTNAAHRHTFVVHRGRLHRLPDGFLMMAPTRLWPLALTPILSPLGKLRAAMEYFIPPRRDTSDESMGAFVRRRLGREVFQRLVEPLVSSVYAADMEKLSVLATLSQFREMELEYGSLIRAMRRRMKGAKKEAGRGDSGARYSMFVTPRNGLSSIVDAIAARLPPRAIRLGAPVERLTRSAGGWEVWTHGESGRVGPESFDAVILATPSHVAASLLGPVDVELARMLSSIEHSGTAILSVGYERGQVAHPLDGMGAVVPGVENSPILACSFSSQKYPHRAPEGRVLLRVFAGGARRPELAEMVDDQLRPLLLGEIERLLGIEGRPVYENIAHWPRTMPQFHVGHKQLVARIFDRVAKLPSLALAGNAFQGVGIPHCIHSGQQAADRVLAAGTVEAEVADAVCDDEHTV